MKKLILLSSALLIGCNSLPTSGPNYRAITERQNVARVNSVILDNQTVQKLYLAEQNQKFNGFNNIADNHDQIGTVHIGDVVEISIWEAPPAVLFGSTFNSEGQGSGASVQLPPQMVNAQGTVNVPFIGNMSVSGKTPEAIQAQIVASLARKANQPQALVRIVNNNSKDVTVIRQGNSIRMPLTANKERVLDAVAAVGGVNADTQEVSVQLTRQNQVKTLAMETLIADPQQNIRLNAGDVITLQQNAYSFTGLGAVGNSQQMRFSNKGITLAEAIGRMGGLIDDRADPRGVFVFRYVPFNELNQQQQARWARQGYKAGTDVPTVYQVNLLEPQSMFLMQRFPMQDKDIVYVSNAPLAEFQKFLRMIFSITSPVTSTISSAKGF